MKTVRFFLLALLLAGCSTYDTLPPQWEESRGRLTIEAQACLQADQESFPVKILFLVDCSQSMQVSDPEARRASAVSEIIERYTDDPDVSFALVRFDSMATILTVTDLDNDGFAEHRGFVRSQAVLDGALEQMVAAGSNTRYDMALDAAASILELDMSEAPSDELARSRYVLVFLSDGLPFPVDYDDQVNTDEDIRQKVQEIRQLGEEFGVAQTVFHSAFLAGNNTEETVTRAEDLLQGMAKAGGGTHRTFYHISQLSFADIDFESERPFFDFRILLVTNLSALPSGSGFMPDSDNDGLADSIEIEAGLDPLSPDSDEDGYGDRVEWHRTGTDPLDPQSPEAICTETEDKDRDRLRCCEEWILGTDDNRIDSDADGFPDFHELRLGTVPTVADGERDLDMDGLSNAEELTAGSDPQSSNTGGREFLMDTRIETAIGTQDRCKNITASPVPLIPGENLVLVWSGRASTRVPGDPGSFRVACVWTRHNPDWPLDLHATLAPQDFVAPAQLDTDFCIAAKVVDP